MFSGCSFFLLLLWWYFLGQLDHCMSSPSPSLPLVASKKASSSNSYRTPCLEYCKCGMGKYATFEHQVYIVNCTDTKLTNAELLKHLPLETEVSIILFCNSIRFRSLSANLTHRQSKFIEALCNENLVLLAKCFWSKHYLTHKYFL